MIDGSVIATVYVLGWFVRCHQLDNRRRREARFFDGPVMSDNEIIMHAAYWPWPVLKWVWIKFRRFNRDWVGALAFCLSWLVVVGLWNLWG